MEQVCILPYMQYDEMEILKICLPKIAPWKSFKFRKNVDPELIKFWEKYILPVNMKKP